MTHDINKYCRLHIRLAYLYIKPVGYYLTFRLHLILQQHKSISDNQIFVVRPCPALPCACVRICALDNYQIIIFQVDGNLQIAQLIHKKAIVLLCIVEIHFVTLI